LKILVIGDVTGPLGAAHLKNELWRVRKEVGADLVIVNGENASFITGISPDTADELFLSGADVITGGNHTLQNKAAYTALDETKELLRPINFGDSAPGRGYDIYDALGYRIMVINAMGNVHIEPNLDSPYPFIDKALERMEGKYDFSVLDFHAEATGEKLAMGYAYDGKINVVFGTHTHVPTADEEILPLGTGYITDVGMCGESDGILGMDKETIILRMKTKLPHKFKASCGAPFANGAIFDLDNTTKKTKSVKRIKF
jgi:metallophosphoesterase (TIGR00282 family)